MAEVTLRLRHNPKTGLRELVVHYESDEDALAHEHERDHRSWVEDLLGVPVGALADTVVVERISPQTKAELTQETASSRTAQSEGSG
jgi:hypothetical protein